MHQPLCLIFVTGSLIITLQTQPFHRGTAIMCTDSLSRHTWIEILQEPSSGFQEQKCLYIRKQEVKTAAKIDLVLFHLLTNIIFWISKPVCFVSNLHINCWVSRPPKAKKDHLKPEGKLINSTVSHVSSPVTHSWSSSPFVLIYLYFAFAFLSVTSLLLHQ